MVCGSLYVKQSVLISDIHVHVYGIWSYVSFQLLYIVMTTASVVDRGIKALNSSRVKPKTNKLVLVASTVNTRH